MIPEHVFTEFKCELDDCIFHFRKLGDNKICIQATREKIHDIAEILNKRQNMCLIMISYSTIPDGFKLHYHFKQDLIENEQKVVNYILINVNILIPFEDTVIPSISSVFPCAKWNEREISESLSINFIGHPDPRNLTIPDHWNKIDSFCLEPKEIDYDIYKPPSSEY